MDRELCSRLLNVLLFTRRARHARRLPSAARGAEAAARPSDQQVERKEGGATQRSGGEQVGRSAPAAHLRTPSPRLRSTGERRRHGRRQNVVAGRGGGLDGGWAEANVSQPRAHAKRRVAPEGPRRQAGDRPARPALRGGWSARQRGHKGAPRSFVRAPGGPRATHCLAARRLRTRAPARGRRRLRRTRRRRARRHGRPRREPPYGRVGRSARPRRCLSV